MKNTLYIIACWLAIAAIFILIGVGIERHLMVTDLHEDFIRPSYDNGHAAGVRITLGEVHRCNGTQDVYECTENNLKTMYDIIIE